MVFIFIMKKVLIIGYNLGGFGGMETVLKIYKYIGIACYPLRVYLF